MSACWERSKRVQVVVVDLDERSLQRSQLPTSSMCAPIQVRRTSRARIGFGWRTLHKAHPLLTMIRQSL